VRDLVRKPIKVARLCRSTTYLRAVPYRVAAAVEHGDVVAGLPPLAVVIDVGADRGQFSLVARRHHRSSRIVAFEPRDEAAALYREVLAATGAAPGQVQLIECALGAEQGTGELSVLPDGDSSSLLNPLGQLSETYGIDHQPTQVRTVEVSTLDERLDGVDLSGGVLLKVDVQGAELDVLRGGQATLAQVDHLYLEVSFSELYEGQPLADEVIAFAHQAGFALARIGSVSPSANHIVQADLLFQRADPPRGPAWGQPS